MMSYAGGPISLVGLDKLKCCLLSLSQQPLCSNDSFPHEITTMILSAKFNLEVAYNLLSKESIEDHLSLVNEPRKAYKIFT